jgi:competence protein ComEC
VSTALALTVIAGALAAHAQGRATERDCRLHFMDGAEGPITGWFEADAGGGARPFRLVGGLDCEGSVRALQRGAGSVPPPGVRVHAKGSWRRRAHPDAAVPAFSGLLLLTEVRVDERVTGARFARARARLRGRIESRMQELLPLTWPLASALILARKEALDPAVRDAFAVAGIAHLLAISGFHVGVVVLLVGVVIRGAGAGPRRAPAYAAAVTWLCVGLIGFPDAATRAALILTFVAAARLRARPAGSLGAIASAGIMLFLLDPFALGRPGFQLSFAGALGLVIFRPPVRAYLDAPYLSFIPVVVRDAVAAGIGATLATMPFVAFHFGRISTVGVAATLVATPLVSAAIPGLLFVIGMSWISPPISHFLAGGVGALLRALEAWARWCASPSWASVWVGDTALIGALIGGVSALIGLRFTANRLRRWARWMTITAWAGAGAIAGPLVERSAGVGTIEMVFLDVGQGDALALRSPGGRWIVVDAGPRAQRFDAGARIVLPYLRRRGVGRIEALVLTHPDLDHIGGAEAIIRGFDVGYVIDPFEPTGRDAYIGVLEAASGDEVPWLEARREVSLRLDGVEISILHPNGPTTSSCGGTDSNATSVVLLVRYGEFEALLTGDAPVEVEEAILDDLPSELEVLKVGHHGSNTSTSPLLLARTQPKLAVISVGGTNRYGHPHADVVNRIVAAGANVLRTDVSGDIVIRARRSGLYDVQTEW